MKKEKIIFTSLLFFAAAISAKAQSWSLTGNSGTNTTTNFIGTKDAQALIFKTGNAERIRIANNGFVGIGTTTPKALLNLPSKGGVTLSATDNFLLGSVTSNNLAFDYNKLQARNNGAASTLQLNPNGGAVALGNVSGTANPGLYVGSNAVSIGGQYTQPGYALTVNQGHTNNGVYLYRSAGSSEGYLLYGSNYGSRSGGMFIENLSSDNGYYAIVGRTYGPGNAIVGINANGAAGSASVSGYNYGSGSGVYGTSIDGVGLYADGDNNYGIYARTTNATYAGYFNRSIFVNGSVFTPSDEKLKQNIQDFTSAMDVINQLHPKKYDYRQDGNYKLMKLSRGTHYGLIAQDVEKVLPYLVQNTKFETSLEAPTIKPDSNGKNDLQQNTKSETIDFKAVNYTELIPIMIKAMQEMQETINSQQQKIEALENRDALSNTVTLSSNSSSQATLNTKATGAYLKQNAPNPFTQNTVINYYIPQNAGKAFINITDMNGRLIKTFSAAGKGNGQLMIEGGQLTSGTYQYSLIVDGEPVETKKMVIIK